MATNDRITSFVTFPPSLLSLGGLIVALCLLYFLFNREATPIRDVPGPFLASISQLWIVIQQRKLQRPILDLALHRKYGSIVRIAPNEVMVSSPRSRKMIYGAGSKFTKGDWYSATGDCGWSGDDQLDFLSELNMEKYRFQRRLIGGAYTPGFVKEVEGHLDEILQKNVKIMARRAGMSVNVDSYFDWFSSDCIQAVTFGETLGFIEANRDCGAMAFIHGLWLYMHWIGYLPTLHRIRKWYINAIRPQLKPFWSCMGKLKWQQPKPAPQPPAQNETPCMESIFSPGNIQFGNTQINLRAASKSRPSHPTTIADKLFQIQSEKPALTTPWIKEMCFANFNAGVETIGVTISTFLAYIMSHPGCQARIQEEIEEARKDGKLSEMPKLKEIEGLPYLSACLSESRRLHPPFAHTLARVVPSGGAELEGCWVPGGTTVGLNPWVLGRDKELYGEDADVFRPERWLEFSPEQLKTLDANNLAEAIYTKAIPLLLMNLEFKFTEPEKPRRMESTFITRLDHVMVHWEARQTAQLAYKKV
ncbi:Nn.00g077250.m01.CDS01 [Neocucurbitaria sp. VM-36]